MEVGKIRVVLIKKKKLVVTTIAGSENYQLRCSRDYPPKPPHAPSNDLP